MRARYAGFEPVGSYHRYLCAERGLPVAVLAEPRFAERVRVDERGNAIFPHFNADGLCGWEARNSDFTFFAAGGTKGLWCSVPAEGDDRLVIAESAIDALSYAAIMGWDRARFISCSGALGTQQPGLFVTAMRTLPRSATVVLALDNDEGGDRLADQIALAFARAERADLRLHDDRPQQRGTDWNDEVRKTTRSPSTFPPGLKPGF